MSPNCERAIEDAFKHGNALLKFISRNNVGLTGSHECGFYLPKVVHGLFTPNPPEKGLNTKHELKVTWQDGRVTDSVVTWYGTGTRSEWVAAPSSSAEAAGSPSPWGSTRGGASC